MTDNIFIAITHIGINPLYLWNISPDVYGRIPTLPLFLMSMKIRNHLYIFISSLLLLSFALLTGCGTPRQSTNSPATSHYDKKLTSAQEGELVQEAKKWLGTKYRYGGHSRSGTDCSGMVMEVYRKVCDVKLPRSSREQCDFCKKIKRDELRRGDLVFFSTGKGKSTVSHVGLYIGDGEIIHASSSRGVIVSRLDERYFQRAYHSSGRVMATAGVAAAKAASIRSDGDRPSSATSSGNVKREVSLDELIKGKVAVEPSPEKKNEAADPSLPSSLLLDDVIDQKIDSIYSDFFD